MEKAKNLATVIKLLKEFEKEKEFCYCLDFEKLDPNIAKDFKKSLGSFWLIPKGS